MNAHAPMSLGEIRRRRRVAGEESQHPERCWHWTGIFSAVSEAAAGPADPKVDDRPFSWQPAACVLSLIALMDSAFLRSNLKFDFIPSRLNDTESHHKEK